MGAKQVGPGREATLIPQLPWATGPEPVALDCAARCPADPIRILGGITRASPLPRVEPNWTRPTGREPAVLSSRCAGHGGISRRKECRDELSAIPQRTPSSERLTPTAVVARAASRDVWREARPLGRCTAARNLRNSSPRNVTPSSPGRSCHETSWMVNRIQQLSRAYRAPS